MGKEFDKSKAKRIFIQTGSWRKTAKALGVHPQTVKNALEPLGFKTAQRVGRTKTWDMQKALDLRKEGKTYKQIGEILQVSASTIHKGLKRCE